MGKPGGLDVVVRVFTLYALAGAMVCVGAVVTGALGVISVEVATGVAAGGFLLSAVSTRAVVRFRRRLRGDEVIAAPASRRDLAVRWRVAAAGNTVAGILLSTLAIVFLPLPWKIAVTLVMAVGILLTWHFERRIGAHRTGA